MRPLIWIVGALIVSTMSMQALAGETREPSGLKTCKIVTGYGTAIGKGSTIAKATEEARLSCGTHMIDQYFAQRQNIPDDVKDDLALACVNLPCQ